MHDIKNASTITARRNPKNIIVSFFGGGVYFSHKMSLKRALNELYKKWNN